MLLSPTYNYNQLSCPSPIHAFPTRDCWLTRLSFYAAMMRRPVHKIVHWIPSCRVSTKLGLDSSLVYRDTCIITVPYFHKNYKLYISLGILKCGPSTTQFDPIFTASIRSASCSFSMQTSLRPLEGSSKALLDSAYRLQLYFQRARRRRCSL